MSKIAKCPRCGKKTNIAESPFRPFCSERCKLLDLGNWLSGDYRIPDTDTSDGEDQEPAPPEDPDKE